MVDRPSLGVTDFYLSRAGADAAIARRVSKILQQSGFTVSLQDEDFRHSSFVKQVQEAMAKSSRVVVLLSRAYLRSEYCRAEATVPLAYDPLNKRGRLVVFRIEECEPDGILREIAYTDLVPVLSDYEAMARVVRGAAVVSPIKVEAKLAAAFERTNNQILHEAIRPDPGFFGVGEQLANLERALWGHSGAVALTSSAAVTGLGGVGKSALAREYAWRNRGRYEGAWWLNAETLASLHEGLIALGDRFMRSPHETLDRQKAAQEVLKHVSMSAAQNFKPWLLIYDNVQSPDEILGLIPREGVHVILTSRWTDWHGVAEELRVDVFTEQMAVDFLLTGAPYPDEIAARALARELGFLPLALDQAHSYVLTRHWSFDEYRAQLTELIREAPRGVVYPASVAATFSLAIERAIANSPEAEWLLGLCAYMAPASIPLSLFTADVLSEPERAQAVAALSEVSLVHFETAEAEEPVFNVHRLVQVVTRDRLSDRHTELSAEALRLVAEAFPVESDDPKHSALCARLLPHAKAVLEFAPEFGSQSNTTLKLLNRVALYLWSRGQPDAAEPLLRRALQITEKNVSADSEIVATALINLGALTSGMGRLAEAEPLLRRALAVIESTFGPDDQRVAEGLRQLGLVYQQMGRLQEAEPLILRALAIDEAVLGPQHPLVSRDLNIIASLYQGMGRFAKAEPLLRRALATDEKTLSIDHPSVARRLNNLASLLQATNRLDEAEPLLRRAIAIDEAAYGPDHPSVAIDISNLAQLLQETGRLEEAEPLLRRALYIFERSLGPTHPSVAVRLNNLAQLLQSTNRLHEAEIMYEAALSIDVKAFGSEHVNVALDLNNLGRLLQEVGRTSEAESQLRKALEILQKALGEENPNTRLVRDNLDALMRTIETGHRA